jgi:hypothetical protein
MAGITIRVEGAEKLIAGLTRLEQLTRVKAEIENAGRFMQGKLREYPVKSPMPNPLIRSNDRVRRGFFYHLKHGNISVPYRRTTNLADKWTVATRRGGWEAVVGNNTDYARLVQGPKQTFQHRASGWLTVSQAISVYSPRVEFMIRSALEKEVADVG